MLKNLLARLTGKALSDSSEVVGSLVRRFDGSGTNGSQRPEFNHDAAVRQFSTWVYAASMHVAKALAKQKLRLYVKNRTAGVKLYDTRPVHTRRKDYLIGYEGVRPSNSVLSKIADFGSDFEEVTEPHPALTVLRAGNEFDNGFQLTINKFLYEQLCGNAYWAPVFDDALKVPTSYWLLPPQWTRVIPDDEEYIAGYEFGSTPINKTVYERDEVIHFKMPSVNDPYYGEGALQAVWSTIHLHNEKRTTDSANFENRGRPDWLMIVKAGVTDKTLERFEANVERKLRGANNSGRLLTIPNDVDLRQLNFPPDIIGDSDRVLQEIASAFGVPFTVLTGNHSVSGGASEDATRSFAENTVLPYLCMDEEKLNEEWLPLFGLDPSEAVLAYDNPVPEDRAAELAEDTALVAAGIRTINEARARRGDEPIRGGDEPRINGQTFDALNAQPAGGLFGLAAPAPTQQADMGPVNDRLSNLAAQVGELVAQNNAAKSHTPSNDPQPSGLGASDKGLGDGSLHDGRGVLDNPGDRDTDLAVGYPEHGLTPEFKAYVDGLFIKADADEDVREDEPDAPHLRLERELAGALEAAGAAILGLLSEPKGLTKRLPASLADDIVAELARMGQTITPLIEETIEQMLRVGADAGLSKLGEVTDGTFEVAVDVSRGVAREFAEKLAQQMQQATADALQNTLSEGISNGETVAQLRARVEATGAFDRSRAERIARTESARAYVDGQEMGWSESGVVSAKKWLLAPDACPICKAMAKAFNKGGGLPLGADLASVLGSDSIATSEGMFKLNPSFPVKGPPGHPNCRCDLVAVLQEGD